MKKLIILILIALVSSCTSTQLTDSWKNPDIETYAPSKVLVVGLTSNIEAKQKFETKLKDEFLMRGTDAYTSFEVFPKSFKTEKLTEHIEKHLKGINYEYHVVSDTPMDHVVNAYTQTHSIDAIALLVQKESLFERFFTGSSTTEISKKLKVPLLVFHV